MEKTGFRGERKENPLPVPLPRRGDVVTSRQRRKKGNVETEKRRKPPPSPLNEGEYGDGKREEKLEN